MSTSLAEAIAAVRGHSDLVVWAGVGYGADIGAVRRLGCGRLLCLEPHPSLHERLTGMLEPGEREVLLPMALWRETGSHPFHAMSDPLQSSLLPPERLLRVRPNLHVVSEDPVETRTLDDLCAGEVAGGDGLLILDICGAEVDVIAAASVECLARFSDVVVRAGSLHRGSEQTAGIAEQLSRHGLLPHSAHPKDDWWLFSRTSVRMEEARNARRQAEVDAFGDAARIRQERDALAARMAGLEETLALRAAERDAAVAQLDERDARIAMLAEEVGERTRERDSAVAEASDRDRRIVAVTAALESITAERDAHARQGSAWERERDEAIEQLARSRARVADLERQLEEAQQAMSLGLKLQSQYQADLRELQDRYRESRRAQERQRDLLARVSERLGAASQYFHGIADERRDGPADDPGQDQELDPPIGESGPSVVILADEDPPGVRPAQRDAPAGQARKAAAKKARAGRRPSGPRKR